MRKKILLFSALGSLILGAAAFCATELFSPSLDEEDVFSSRASLTAPTDADAYDQWLNSWSKPNHLYVHYNRGDKNDYDKFCFWMWNDQTDTDGTLWAYSSNKTSFATVDLCPMTTHWMYESDIQSGEANTVYKDNFGVIADVSLDNLHEGKVKKGQQAKSATYDGCDDFGFLFPQMDSMNGANHWTSDGGKDNDVDDWRDEENWRDVAGGKACHIFFSSGQLTKWSYYAGSGIPQVKVNPIDADRTGNYRSKTETIVDNYANRVSTTSNSFKELGVGYQIFVASFRDSNGDGKGDLRGIIDSLDYLKDLGVDVLWLTPIQKSGSYHGYDIIDYYAVDEKFGTIDDYRELIFKAHEKGMKVLMDLVLNHTSKSNTWFTKSEWGVNSGIPGTETDNTGINWRNVFTWKYGTDKIKTAKRTANGEGIVKPVEYVEETVEQNALAGNGASWYKSGESNYYYYGKFGSDMPEINYENKDTRKLVKDMAKYWLSFGLDGFRLDAVKHIYMKDEVNDTGSDVIMTDVGTSTAYDEQNEKEINKPYDYSSDLTKNISFWKEFAIDLKTVYPDCFLVGENFDGYGTRTAGYYQALDSQFDFSNYYHVPTIYNNAGGATAYSSIQAEETFYPFSSNDDQQITVDEVKYTVPGGKRGDFINGAFTSNHDVMRAINAANGVKSGNDVPAAKKVTGTDLERNKAKIQAAITLLSPGISWIYYGDELGMSSNTDQHIALYENDNCIDTWYRQPFVWQGEKGNSVRPSYQNGKYKFSSNAYDDWNKALLNNNKGVTLKNDGSYEVKNNDIYDFYKGLTALKALYPKGAKVQFDKTFTNSSTLVMRVTGEGKSLVIFINTGATDDGYTINAEGYNQTPVAQIGCSGKGNGTDIPKFSVVAFQAN